MKRTFSFVILLAVFASVATAGMELTSAKIYKKQGEIAKAIEFYDLAVAKEPDNAEALFERGELLGIIAMDQSQVGLRKKIAGETDTPQREVLKKMVADFDAVRAMGDDKKAKKYAKKIDEIIQDIWWEFYGKAVASDSVYRGMEESGSLENSEAVINNGLAAATTAIMLDPGHWSSRFVYAQLKGFQERDDDYVAAWSEALSALDNSDLKSNDPETYASNRTYVNLQLIQYFYSKSDYVKTLEIADRMLSDEPGLVEAVQYKAYALATMASDEERPVEERDSLKLVALDALTSAKDSNPDDENIIYYIGQFNLQLKDTAAALAAFDEYLLRAPDDPIVLAMQGVIYLESEKFGDLKKAIEKLGAAKDADPENSAFWTNYGIALLRDGQNEAGRKAMEKGSELSGN